MGHMRHHAIIVTSFDEKLLEEAHVKATEIGCAVTPIVPSNVDFYSSFLVASDGSKEGWGESDRGDVRRDQFTAWLDGKCYMDCSSPFNWVEVQYGDDNNETLIVRDGDEPLRSRWAAEEDALMSRSRAAGEE